MLMYFINNAQEKALEDIFIYWQASIHIGFAGWCTDVDTQHLFLAINWLDVSASKT